MSETLGYVDSDGMFHHHEFGAKSTAFNKHRRERAALVALRIARWVAINGTDDEKSGSFRPENKTPLGVIYDGIIAEDGLDTDTSLIRVHSGVEPHLPGWEPKVPPGYIPGPWNFRIDGDVVRWTREQ